MDIVRKIITELEEPNKIVIAKIVRIIGEEEAAKYLAQTKALIAGGYDAAEPGSALLRADGQPRTKGGTFFALVRREVTDEIRARLWPPHNKRGNPRRSIGTAYALQNQLFAKEMSKAEVEIEIAGIPSKIARKNEVVSAILEVEVNRKLLQHIVPRPKTTSTYRILMQEEDYNPVQTAVEEQGHLLKVKGYCHINKKRGVGTVLAYELTSFAPVTEAEEI